MKHPGLIQSSSPRASRRIAEVRQINKIVFVLLALACLLFIPLHTTQAQTGLRILIVTTDETKVSDENHKKVSTPMNDNIVKEFENNKPDNSIVVTDKFELGNGKAAPAGFFSGYDIVIVSAVFADIDSADRKAISDAVLNKRSNVFVFFVDTCGPCSTENETWFLKLIQDNATSFMPGQGEEVTSRKDFPLNLNSPYHTSFTEASTINGGWYKPYTDVPVNYILYKESDAVLPSTGNGNAYGLLLPLGEAKGSCTFATTDGTKFDATSYVKNENKIARAFYKAAQGGSCFADVDQADLSVTITASADPVNENGKVTYTVGVKNAGRDTGKSAQAKITLPDGLTVESSADCTEDPTGVLTCSWAEIAKDGAEQVTFTATADQGTSGQTLTTKATVSAQTADPHLRNNTASENIRVDEAQGTLRVVSSTDDTESSITLHKDTTVELIIDASGSMTTHLLDKDGRDSTRIAIAKQVLQGIVTNDLPYHIPTALRAFGSEGSASGCDTKLLVAPEALTNRDALNKTIADVPPIGRRTAIAQAIRAVEGDLRSAPGPKLVVLVTDGAHNCSDSPLQAIKDLNQAGFDIRVNIVGFAIGNKVLKDKFQGWAAAGGGNYYDATDSEQLDKSIKQALSHPFTVTNKATGETFSGTIDGPALELPAGQYTIKMELEALDSIGIPVKSGETREIKVLR